MLRAGNLENAKRNGEWCGTGMDGRVAPRAEAEENKEQNKTHTWSGGCGKPNKNENQLLKVRNLYKLYIKIRNIVPSKKQSVKHYEKNSKNTAVFYSTSSNDTGGHHWCQLLCTNKPGLRPSGSFININAATTGGVSGSGVILLGSHQVEPHCSRETQTFISLPSDNH